MSFKSPSFLLRHVQPGSGENSLTQGPLVSPGNQYDSHFTPTPRFSSPVPRRPTPPLPPCEVGGGVVVEEVGFVGLKTDKRCDSKVYSKTYLFLRIPTFRERDYCSVPPETTSLLCPPCVVRASVLSATEMIE